MGNLPPIDYVGLAAALLERAETLVPMWLPGGFFKAGRYYCGGLSGGKGKSMNVDMRTGTWIDNGGNDEDKGGDLISLYAAIHGLPMYQAALKLRDELGMAPHRPLQAPAKRSDAQPPPASAGPPDERSWEGDAPAQPAKKGQGKPESDWRVVTPVPAHAAPPTFKHFHRGQPERTWTYTRDGKVYGHIARFATSEGGKEILPYTWCEDVADGRGLQRWHWKQWPDPRPLYLAAGLLAADPALVPVVVVEGEKCADAGHELLGHEFDFVTWPGGCKTVDLADWSWLKGRVVYLWPDCDAQREKLKKAEREANVDPLSKPIWPEHKQPGMQAMVKAGTKLMADHACSVLMMPIPAPGAVADGWDIADAIAQGWTADQVRDFIRSARPFVPPNDEARAKAATQPDAGAGGDEDGKPDGWRLKLLETEKGAIKAARENVVLALDGMARPGKPWLPGIPEAAGVIAFNEFSNDVMKLKPAPWDSPAGPWAEVDELLLGEWLVREHWLPSMPRNTLEEAVRMVAFRRRFHPVRQYLEAIEWDGKKRLSTWLRRACLAPQEKWDNNDPLQQYLARVGTWFLQGMVARVMSPGIKFDYMLILEGPQGMRKSTLLKTLGGDWFADTGLILGNKDSYQQLQGILLYEIGELDAFSKADITEIKRFVASSEDNFRASFDRRARKYPRQLVFGGTTNERHYLTDPTGNRRFWPFTVTRLIDIDWVAANRDQLLAEALVRFRAGERMYPTQEEEETLFKPQQELRESSSALADQVAFYVTSDVAGRNRNKFTLVEVLERVGITLEKLGPGKYHEKQAASALRKLGWTEKRSSVPPRPWEWHRPKPEATPEAPQQPDSTGPTQGHQPSEGDDDCPF